MYYNLICNFFICTPICTKFCSCKKWVLQEGSKAVVRRVDASGPVGHGTWMWRRRMDKPDPDREQAQNGEPVIVVGIVPCSVPLEDQAGEGNTRESD
jgi:hypothetical protein